MERWKKAREDCFWYSYSRDGNAWISECGFINECYVCPCLVNDYEDDYECENFITNEDARQLIRDFLKHNKQYYYECLDKPCCV